MKMILDREKEPITYTESILTELKNTKDAINRGDPIEGLGRLTTLIQHFEQWGFVVCKQSQIGEIK